MYVLKSFTSYEIWILTKIYVTYAYLSQSSGMGFESFPINGHNISYVNIYSYGFVMIF